MKLLLIVLGLILVSGTGALAATCSSRNSANWEAEQVNQDTTISVDTSYAEEDRGSPNKRSHGGSR